MKVFSGIQPTGPLHIGSYAGAIRQWLDIKKDPANEGLFCIVDLHALVSNPAPDALTRDTMETAAGYLAFGLQDEKFPIFIQSHVPAHAELAWLLQTITGLGELERMTQFKEKGGRQDAAQARDALNEKLQQTLEEIEKLKFMSEGAHHRFLREDFKNIQETYTALKEKLEEFHAIAEGRGHTVSALLNYPALMAADILLYDTEAVPVGEDQTQHLELTRDIARRFNHRFGETFVLPKTLMQKNGSRIMSLQDPAKKMSKSLGPSHCVGIFEPEEDVRKKFKSAVTDSGSDVRYDPKEKPAISNLLEIYGVLTGASLADAEKEFHGVSYAAFKEKLADTFFNTFAQVRERKQGIDSDPHHILHELKEGAEKARAAANKKLRMVQLKMGLV